MSKQAATVRPRQAQAPLGLVHQVSAGLGGLATEARRSLVEIRDQRGRLGAGTIWQRDGLVITSAHVVSCTHPAVTLPDERLASAHLIAHSRRLDVAVLAVDASDLATVNLGDSRCLRPGEWVLAMGHPRGVGVAATAGVVIGLGPGSQAGDGVPDMIHLSTKLQPGYSGGPLLDASGRLVGVVAMMSGPQVGLAVPVHVIKAFLRQALAISSQTRRMALGRHCVSTAGRAAASPAGVRGDRAVFSPGDAT